MLIFAYSFLREIFSIAAACTLFHSHAASARQIRSRSTSANVPRPETGASDSWGLDGVDGSIRQTLFDQGVLVRGDTARLARPLNAIRIPATVQGILASRIDRLPAEEKDLLQAMAVIGRRSPLSLLKRVVSWPENHLEHMLADLQFLEFVYEQITRCSGNSVPRCMKLPHGHSKRFMWTG